MAASINPKVGKPSLLLTQPHKILILVLYYAATDKAELALEQTGIYNLSA